VLSVFTAFPAAQTQAALTRPIPSAFAPLVARVAMPNTTQMPLAVKPQFSFSGSSGAEPCAAACISAA